MNPVIHPIMGDGRISNVTTFQKIQPFWKDAVETTKKQILASPAGSDILSIYLRGSVAVGTAIEYISDLDCIVIVPYGHDKSWRKHVEEDLTNRFNFIKYVEIGVFSTPHLDPSSNMYQPSKAFILRTQSVHLWGYDLLNDGSHYPKIPEFKADLPTAQELYYDSKGKLLEHIQADTDLFWCKRQLLRLGAYLTMLNTSYYTKDVFLISDDLASIFFEDEDTFANLKIDVSKRTNLVSREELIYLLNKFESYLFSLTEDEDVLHPYTRVALSFSHRPTLSVNSEVQFTVFENMWTFDLLTKEFFQLLWETKNGLEIQTLAERSNLEYSNVIDLIEDLLRNGLVVKT